MRRALAVLALVLTASCGTRVRLEAHPTPPPTTPSPSSSASASPTAAPSPTGTAKAPSTDPLALLGWWRLTYPAYGWSVGFGDELTVVLDCGSLSAAWEASPSGLFAAAELGGDGACLEKAPRPDTAWYATPRAFAVSDELVLVAPSGAVAARLVRAPAPPGARTDALSPAHRARLAQAAPLPAGLAPAARSSLEGRWAARGEDAGNGRGYVAFGTGWTWRGSDGCNGDGGAFAVGAGGDFLSTTGATTLIGCDTTPAPSWVHAARRAGLDPGGALVLLDVRGKELGRLWRS